MPQTFTGWILFTAVVLSGLTANSAGAEKLTPEEQRRRFIEAAREAGASESEADFNDALKRIAKPKKPD